MRRTRQCPESSPGAEDLRRLAGFDLTRQLLESARRDKVDEVAERVDEQLLPYAQQMPGWERGGMAGAELDDARAWIANREWAFADWIAKIDDAIALVDREREGYRLAMAHAARGERIVWHSSRIGAGWLPERLSIVQQEQEASAGWWLGFQQGTTYVRLRDAGKSPVEAALGVMGRTAMDLSGATAAIEAVIGSELFTGRQLPGPERVVKGVLAIVSAGSLVALGGPRIGPFAQMVKGTRLALVQAEGTFAFSYPVLIVGESGAALALSQSEALVLAQAGVLQMSAVSAGGGPPPMTAPGLKGVYGKTRGGGSEKARTYQKKVTGRGDSVFVNGVEFDGWRAKDRTLIDAKLAKGKGSWYDVTGNDSFTQRFKIPEIEKQAMRQIAAMQGSGAARIEWIVSDPFIARTLDVLFRRRGISITIAHIAP